MRSRRRHTLSLLLSTAIHAVALAWGLFSFNPDIEMPEIDFELAEVELLDPDMLQGMGGEPEPEPEPEVPITPPTPTPTPEDEANKQEEEERKKQEEEERKKREAEEKKKKAEEARKKKAEQRKHFASESTHADQLGPPTSTFHLLLVPKKIRKLPFAETAFSLLEPWPDFDFLVRKGGLDPLNDFDHIVIASPNIRNELETFLAVDYKGPRSKIVKAIERAVTEQGEVIEWIDKGGFMRGNPRPADPDEPDRDPRWFVFHPKKKVAMFVRDAFLPDILADSEDTKGAEGSAREFVDNLTKLQRFAAQQPLSGMQLKIADLRNSLKRAKLPFPTPDGIEISVEAAKAPVMVVKVQLADEVSAKKFRIWFEEELRDKFLTQLKFRFTLKPIVDKVDVSVNEAVVTLRTEFTQDQIELVLDQLSAFVLAQTQAVDRRREEQRREKERKEREQEQPDGDDG